MMYPNPDIGFTQIMQYQEGVQCAVARHRLVAQLRRQRTYARMQRTHISLLARLAHALSLAFADLACVLGYADD